MNVTTDTQAIRLKRPSWKDPRLLIGILLVLVSVAGVITIVGSADRTTEVYAAKQAIEVGQKVTSDNLMTVKVRLDDVESNYVKAHDGLPEGRVALQRIEPQHLVPKRSLATPDSLERKPVAVTLDDPLPTQAVAGSRVDVWVSPPDSRNGFAEPQKVLPAVEISSITPASSALGASRSTVVLVLVNEQQLPRLLGALANKAKVAVVWNPSGSAK
ncbi:SAF domain-containing protein [Arthrobacter sp. M4]|uniref:SAF domain-containing protein n=1 Tax=Arthrobacter sp. M4 TaxID=218160 RepID=UPI001CDD76AC|nr:SAF domain-containing protein [Arthrobacter sp. M4]MCA4132273.1 SAF domain-containing protein [Arthrobacter sp. M4]